MARAHGSRALLATLAAMVLAIAGDAALAKRKLPPPESSAAASTPTDLFGAGEIAHPPATDFAKWTETLARYEVERRRERALCNRGDCALVQWREFLAGLEDKDPLTQLRAVNAYLNRIRYRTDLENYGEEDYWATPRQFFARGGDCEDYALAKYLSLRALGWPAERLRVAVIHDNARDLVHAALIAYHGGNAYLLDIEITEVTDHRNVARYVPIFSINEKGWWSYRTLPPVEVVNVVGRIALDATERRSPHLRHKLGRPAKLAARPAPAPRAAAWRSPHMKHSPGIGAKRHRLPPPEPAVVASSERGGRAEPAPSAVAAPEPRDRIEEIFLPGAK